MIAPAVKETQPVPTVVSIDYNIDKLADAVARQETANCTLWYGASYNNCFGIKNGNTAPCVRVWANRMCIYNTPEESYLAFKKIRTTTGYDWLPTLKKAETWTGKDRARIWLQNVTNFYHNNNTM